MEDRYKNQNKLLGKDRQSILSRSRVLVVGAGGIGSPLLYFLAGAGVGTIIIADGDEVSLSNLNRQTLYTDDDIGKNKALSAAKRLKAFNSDIKLIPIPEMFSRENGERLLEGCDLVALAADNRETRLTVNRFCVKLGIPLVDAGVDGLSGYVTALTPPETPCLECLLGSELPPKKLSGTLGAVSGLLGSVEALAAIELLIGNSGLKGKLLAVDGAGFDFELIDFNKRADCPVCGRTKR